MKKEGELKTQTKKREKKGKQKKILRTQKWKEMNQSFPTAYSPSEPMNMQVNI